MDTDTEVELSDTRKSIEVEMKLLNQKVDDLAQALFEYKTSNRTLRALLAAKEQEISELRATVERLGLD